MAGDGKAKPPAKRAPRKAAAKRAPRGKPKPPAPTPAERAKAAEQIASVTPIRGKAPKRGPASGTTPTSPTGVLLAERRRTALNLRRLGLTWSQVAEKILEDDRFRARAPKYNHADAHNDARTLLDSVTIEAVQGVREEDLALLLSLQRSVYPAAMDGDLKAVKAMLDILERRSRYLGLDAPIRHQLTGADGGAIQIDTTDESQVYDAALAALDSTLPHLDPIQLPGVGGTL